MRLGEPLYETAPRLSDELQVFPPACIGDECVSVVEAHGPGFFDRPDWRSRLRGVVRKHTIRPLELSVESEAERISAIWMELFDSRRLIEERLPGKEVRHICFPWHVVGRTALGMAKEAGYELCWMGKVDGRFDSRIPRETLAARIGGDFFFRLPGEGRVSLGRTLFGKAIRRARHGSPYLTH
jgi:hypothetical protein